MKMWFELSSSTLCFNASPSRQNNCILELLDHFIIPANEHNVKSLLLLKYIKIMEAATTRFGLQKNIIREPRPVLS